MFQAYDAEEYLKLLSLTIVHCACLAVNEGHKSVRGDWTEVSKCCSHLGNDAKYLVHVSIGTIGDGGWIRRNGGETKYDESVISRISRGCT